MRRRTLDPIPTGEQWTEAYSFPVGWSQGSQVYHIPHPASFAHFHSRPASKRQDDKTFHQSNIPRFPPLKEFGQIASVPPPYFSASIFQISYEAILKQWMWWPHGEIAQSLQVLSSGHCPATTCLRDTATRTAQHPVWHIMLHLALHLRKLKASIRWATVC